VSEGIRKSDPVVPTNLKRIVLIANPFSGTGPTLARVETLQSLLMAQGCQCHVIWEKPLQQEFLRKTNLHDNVHCILVVGGDGTVGDVVNYLSSDIPIATLPCGNENLFAQEFGFNCEVHKLVEGVLRGKTRRCDLIQAGERKFTLMLGAGFDAEVAHRVAKWRIAKDKLKRIRRISYLFPIFASLRFYRYPRIEIQVDGRQLFGYHFFVFNVSRYALGLPFTREAEPDNGHMEWILFQKSGFWNMLTYFFGIVRNTHRRRADVAHGKATHLSIRSLEPVPIQIDGDAFGTTPLELSVLPGRLSVVDMQGIQPVQAIRA
jgi:diacylglycerol kinase (ATP)